MALINCHECGSQVSTEAAACAKCGAPLRSRTQTRPVIKALGAIVLVLLVAGFFAGRQRSDTADSDQEPAVALVEAPISVTAQELAVAYKENTVAADNRFKGRRLLVQGVVASIDTDIANEAYLSLVGLSDFEHVHAGLSAAARQVAASLRPGSPALLACVGNGDIIKTPMLKDCQFRTNEQPVARTERQSPAVEPSLPIDQLSEQQFNAQFRCPESYSDDDGSRKGVAESVQWYGTHHPSVTPEGLARFRMKLLTEHGCAKALANIQSGSLDGAATAGESPQGVSPQQAVPPSLSSQASAVQEQPGPSYDCTKARSTPEKVICADPELAALDSGLLTYFKATRAVVRAKLSAAQYVDFTAENKESWNEREAQCKDKECLLSWFAVRAQQFDAWNKLAAK